MNKVFIVGRLTKEPEHRTTPNGVSVATFTVAVTRRMNRDESDFISVVTWRGLADNCGKYLVKGQQVAVLGELRTRNYEAKDGTKRYVTEVQADDVEFLAKPSGQSGQGQGGGYGGAQKQQAAPKPADDIFAGEGMNGVLVEDEELPF